MASNVIKLTVIGKPDGIEVDGVMYLPGAIQLPRKFDPSSGLDSLKLKTRETLDSIFDENTSDEEGRSFKCYEDTVAKLMELTGAGYVNLSFLQKTDGLATLPENLKKEFSHQNMFIKINTDLETHIGYLSENNLLFSPLQEASSDVVPDENLQGKFKATYLLKTCGGSNDVAYLELYGLPSNDEKIKAILSSATSFLDSRIHDDLSNERKLLRALGSVQNNPVQEERKIEIGNKEVIQEEVKKGHYYLNGSFFEKNLLAFNQLMEKARWDIAFVALGLPEARMFYNNINSKEFIDEVQLTEKLAKLNLAATFVEKFKGPGLTREYEDGELKSIFENDSNLYCTAMGNAIIALYSFFPKRIKFKDRLIFPELKDEFEKEKINKALYELWFGDPMRPGSHFIYNEKEKRFYISQGGKNVPIEDNKHNKILMHIKNVLPYINDAPHQSNREEEDNKLIEMADSREACEIYTLYTQRTDYYIPGHEKDTVLPHTPLEGLKFLKDVMGYDEEAKILAFTVYHPFPLKNKSK